MKDYRQFISLVGGNLRYIRNEISVLYKVRFHRVHTTVWIHSISCVLTQLCMLQTVDGKSMHKQCNSLSRMLPFICCLIPPFPTLERW